MAKAVTATPKMVRSFFKENADLVPEAAKASVFGNGPLGARGRLHSEAVQAYEKANPGHKVIERTNNDNSRELTYYKVNKKGARRPYKVVLPMSEIRRLAGVEATRGRLSKAALEAAGEAYLSSL